MGDVVDLQPKKHVYEIDRCAGCGDVIAGEYTELGLPNGNGDEIKHIALCDGCSGEARKAGAY